MKLGNKEIEVIADYFSNQPVLKAYLFGSYARGEADSNSDIDILVELDHLQKIGLHFITMQMDLEKILGKKVDLVSEGSLSKYVSPIVNSEKQLFYAR